MDIGQKIKALRKERGLALEELGQKVGVGKSTVRKWETGAIANMRRDKISRLADALGVSPAYLIGCDIPAAASFERSPLEQALVERYRKADPATKIAVNKILDLPGESAAGASAG